MKNNKKIISLVFIIVGIALFVLPVLNPQKPIIIPKEDLKKTHGWKLYSNDEYRFSFKYPEGLLSNFQVNSVGKTTQVLRQLESNKLNLDTNPNSYNVIFEADGWKSSDSLTKFINENLPETKNLKKQKIIAGNLEGVRISNADKKVDAFFYYNIFKHGDFIYNFAILSDDPVLIEGNTKLLEDIISTAKFN